MLIRVLDLCTFLEIFVLESLLPALHFLLQLLYFPHLVVVIIPHPTQVATSVFHVQTHREPRALTNTLHWEWLCKSRVHEQDKWKLVRM